MSTPSKISKLLIIDDCEEDRETYRRILMRVLDGEHEFLECSDAITALEVCREQEPDLIFLDFELPGMNGIEFLEKLSGGTGEPPIPVVMLTGQGDENLVVQALEAGASDYVSKSKISPAGLKRSAENARNKHVLREQLKKYQRHLELANEKLGRQNDEIRAFYNSVSHELNTPLTFARDFFSLLIEEVAGPLNETQREYLEIALQGCDQLSACIQDMLEVTRLQTGKFSLQPENVDLARMIQRWGKLMKARAESEGLDLEILVHEDLPMVWADGTRVTQVLNNLVSNAIKFTDPPGHIRVEARPCAVDPDQVQVEVSDTGRGIAPDDIARIFDRFYQTESSDTFVSGGLGLGLAISKEFVERLGGTLAVRSSPGEGSTFTFTLPIAEQALSAHS